MQLEVMNEAKNNNLIVLLDGQEEMKLLGYERYFIPYLNSLSFFEKLKIIFI